MYAIRHVARGGEDRAGGRLSAAHAPSQRHDGPGDDARLSDDVRGAAVADPFSRAVPKPQGVGRESGSGKTGQECQRGPAPDVPAFHMRELMLEDRPLLVGVELAPRATRDDDGWRERARSEHHWLLKRHENRAAVARERLAQSAESPRRALGDGVSPTDLKQPHAHEDADDGQQLDSPGPGRPLCPVHEAEVQMMRVVRAMVGAGEE